ncbi:MAG: Cof-type HAD-IIB family hydrolase [Coprobacillaceae bacterium]
MKYKAIALDLDGTLKSSEKTILPKTKELLMDLAKQGIIVILASGRPTQGMVAEAKELELETLGGYVLSFNGARVVNQKNKEIVYDKIYSKDLAHQVYERGKEYNLAVLTYIKDKIITEDIDDEYVQYEATLNHMEIEKVDDFKATVNESVNKVLLTGKPEYVESILDDFKEPFINNLSVYRSTPFFIEVMDQGVDKASSLDVILKSLNISKEELIAFGDGYNDLSMIRYAGLGVAMGNSVDEVKAEADYITDSNDNEGIFNCLKQLQEKGEI